MRVFYLFAFRTYFLHKNPISFLSRFRVVSLFAVQNIRTLFFYRNTKIIFMKRATKEDFLRNKENKLKSQIYNGEQLYIQIYNFLYNYYSLRALSSGSPIMKVFEAIYIKKLSLPAWKLANYCHISRTSLFNYRNEIVNNFNTCLSKSFPISEIAFTKG